MLCLGVHRENVSSAVTNVHNWNYSICSTWRYLPLSLGVGIWIDGCLCCLFFCLFLSALRFLAHERDLNCTNGFTACPCLIPHLVDVFAFCPIGVGGTITLTV